MAGALWGSICTSGPKSYQSGVQAPVFKGATMETDRQTAGQTAGQMGESSVPRPANTCRRWEGSLVGAEDTGTP